MNIDEDGDGCDLLGCERFDKNDEDWASDIIYNFGTDKDRLLWDEYPGSDDWDDDDWDEAYD